MKISTFSSKSARLAHLVDLFMDGSTTVAQERELFDAFAPGRKVPRRLESYRPMMQWYASLASADGVTAAVSRRRLPRVAVWVSSAAAVAMMATVAVSYMSRSASLPDDYALYQGSYVIRNGHKITDLAQILPEVRRVEQIVSGQQAAVAKSMAAADASAETGVGDCIDMDDPVVREVMHRVFSE